MRARRLTRLVATILFSLLLLLAAATAQDVPVDQMVERGFKAYEAKDYKTALEWYTKAHAAYQKLGRRDGEALMLFGMAAVYKNLERYAECIEALQKARAIYHELKARDSEKRVLQSLASMYAAEAEYFAKEGKPDPESGFRMLLAEVLDALDRTDEAVKAAELAAELRRKAGLPVKQAVSLAQLAYYLSRLNRDDEAIARNLEALKILQEHKDRAGEATVSSNLAGIYDKHGRHAEALDALRRARELHRAIGNRERELSNVMNQASSLYALGRWEEALTAWREARDLARELQRASTERLCASNAGNLLDELGRRAEAERTLLEALALARKLDDRAAIAGTLLNLGAVQNHVARKEDALRSFHEALDLARAAKEDELTGIALSNIGEIHWQLGRYKEALQYYDEALAIFRTAKSESHELITQGNIAALYDAIGKIPEAVAAYRQIIDRMTKLQMTGQLASMLNDLAALEGRSGKSADALRHYGESLALLQRLGRRDAAAVTMRNIGLVHEQMRHTEEALKAYGEARKALRAVGNRSAEGQTEFDIAHLLYVSGRKSQALPQLASAIDLLESVAAGFHVSELKAAFFASAAERYDFAVGAFYDEKKVEDAFDYGERAKARAFLDSLGGAHVNLRRGVPPALAARERELLARLEVLRARLDKGGTAEEQSEMNRLRDEYSRLLGQIALLSPESAALRSVHVVSRPALRKALGPDSVLVSIYVGPRATYAWALTRDGAMQSERIEGGADKVLEEVLSLREVLRSPSSQGPIKPTGTVAAIVAFIERVAAGKKRVLIAPHATLHYLPFGPLADSQGGFLADRWSIVTVPSASAWYYVHTRLGTGNGSALVAYALGNTTPVAGRFSLRGGLGPLPGTLDEARGLADLFGAGSKVYAERDCVSAGLPQRVAFAGYLHFATHGVLEPAAPSFSALAMADGYLTVLDILGLDLRASLVCLSACETASGSLSKGDEVVGLTRAFLHAGTNTVVASLWKVPDASTAALMQSFYRNLHDGRDAAEALRLAQAEVRKRWPSPLYWGAFSVYGDVR